MKKHSCRTYFRIVGIFEAQVVLNALELRANRIIKRGDALPLTKRIAAWDEIEIGFNDNYNVDVNEMIRETLKDLRGKIKELRKLKEDYQLEYYLAIVPEIEGKSDEPKPIISLDDDIIEFLCLTKTKHDVDYYIY